MFRLNSSWLFENESFVGSAEMWAGRLGGILRTRAETQVSAVIFVGNQLERVFEVAQARNAIAILLMPFSTSPKLAKTSSLFLSFAHARRYFTSCQVS